MVIYHIHILTTAEPTATPAAVVAICANIPGCFGCCIMVDGAALGAVIGVLADGAVLIGAAGRGCGEADLIGGALLKTVAKHSSHKSHEYSILKLIFNKEN